MAKDSGFELVDLLYLLLSAGGGRTTLQPGVYMRPSEL